MPSQYTMIDTPLKVLIVEDMTSDAFLIQRQLQKFCTNAEISFSDKELSLSVALKQFLPDIVISDFNLIGFDGFDVVEKVKNFNKEVPIIIITGNLNNEEKAARLIMEGASAFFLKENLGNLAEKLEPLFQKFVDEKSKLMASLQRKRQKEKNAKEIADFLRAHDHKETLQKEDVRSLKDKILNFLSLD